jgi:macrodomain Ter protein organizer (MatP/YcbG family)
MSTVRRSPRLAARERTRSTLQSIQEALQERLEQIEQAPALKDGWITKMMNDFLSSQSSIEDPLRHLLRTRDFLPFKQLDKDQIVDLSIATKRCSILIHTIRGGDHRPLEELEDTTRDMIDTVETLISHMA